MEEHVMSHLARRQYLVAIWDRYLKAGRVEKGRILDEFCAVCGYSRKFAIRLLGRGPAPNGINRRGRKHKYNGPLLDALRDIWHLTGRVCARRLKEAMPEWLEYYIRRTNGLQDHEIKMLLEMSASTIGRKLKLFRKEENRGKSTTRRSNWWFRSHVPIQAENDGFDKPGFVQADTVAHCGDCISGSYAHTVTATDVYTTWTETRAIWGKQSTGVKEAFSSFEKSFPFALVVMKTDSGSEFMNDRVYSFLVCREFPVQLVRSRPYQKNDQCYVEQKNFQHARSVFGYLRLEHPELVEKMNDIYVNYWNPLQNFFIPTMKMESKIREGTKIKKKYGKAKTPFQRVIESGVLSDEQKQALQRRKESLNPIELRTQFEIKLREFFDLTKRLTQTESIKIAA
jgi:hypothetical protein